MKYLKILGLAAIAAAALMAFAGTASATTLTSPKGTIVKTGTVIHAVSEGHVVFDPPFSKSECNLTIEGTTSNEGGRRGWRNTIGERDSLGPQLHQLYKLDH
jgi:ABC-type glycerol-3-phosphate transport system substrate-binding protein